MKGVFEVAGGSITGRNHTTVGKNNQDAYYSISNEVVTLGVVCDGCGSCPHSEVGAKLGVRLVGETLVQHFHRNQFLDWQQLREEILTQLEIFVKVLATEQSCHQIIQDYFLFTVVGALITPQETLIFSLGDGVIAVNEKVTEIGPFTGNAPPYLAYGLLGEINSIDFQIHGQIKTEEVTSILIGTDGVSDLIKAENSLIPGKAETVGSISQFWQDDRYFRNPDMIRRKLSLINREIIKPDWQNQQLVKQVGLLSDDTTLISIRKIPESGGALRCR